MDSLPTASLNGRPPSAGEGRWWLALFAAGLLFHLWGMTVGWESRNMPGVEYRQAQTAISAFFIKQENNFSLEYPTPVLGKPWSIPMEFPLYQWTVAMVSKVTGLGITKSGRLVGIACFYLCLPALFLLLERWRVDRARRWLVLAVVVTCPFYIYYARAVLIECMALMFTLWFWVGYERAVDGRSGRWLAVAVLAGTGAGLVKVTTWMLFLIPIGLWSLGRLGQAFRHGSWKREAVWMAAVTVLPLALTAWWVRLADSIKARNPMADFLNSESLFSFNFGTLESRLSPEFWAMKWRIVSQELSGVPVMAGGLLLALLAGRARWREISMCTGLFAAALVIFPVLYALHDYYYVANTVLLALALGLTLVGLADSPVPRWVVAVAALGLIGGQVFRYMEHQYPSQRGISGGGDGLSQALKALTRADEYVMIVGQDWNSMTPYYAQRRALMIRQDMEFDQKRMERALANLADENLGALVVDGPLEWRKWLVDEAVKRGLEKEPAFTWRNLRIHLPAARRVEYLALFQQYLWDEVMLSAHLQPPEENLRNSWLDVAKAGPRLRGYLAGIKPQPVRFYSTFGPAIDTNMGRRRFGAHPITRLVFALPAGRHTLSTDVFFPVATYQVELQEADATDGVEVSLVLRGADDNHRTIFYRVVNPRGNPADRGEQPIRVDFEMQQAGEVELYFGPGPNGRDTRDWITTGPIVIESR